MTKQKNTKRRRYLKAAAKAPTVWRDLGATKAHGDWRRSRRGLGKFGPASEVRHIKPDE